MGLTKEGLLKKVREYELEKGESFLDRFEYLIPAEGFMNYAYDKGLITKEEYNQWLSDFETGDYEAESIMYCYSNEEEDLGYNVFKFTEDELFGSSVEEYNKLYEKALLNVCGFIVSSDFLLDEVLKEFDFEMK